MQKAQISFDLLLALVIALILANAIITSATNTRHVQEAALSHEQLALQAEKIASIINSADAISDSNYSITLKISKIDYTDANGNLFHGYPTFLLLDSNTLNAKITLQNGSAFDANAFYHSDANKIIDLTQQTTGVLVIRHA